RLHEEVGLDRPGACHAGDMCTAGGLLRLTGGNFRIDVARRENQHEPGFVPERGQSALYGVRARSGPFCRRRAGNVVADVASGCRVHGREGPSEDDAEVFVAITTLARRKTFSTSAKLLLRERETARGAGGTDPRARGTLCGNRRGSAVRR